MAKSRSEIDKEMMYRKIMPSAAKKGGNVVPGADEVPSPWKRELPDLWEIYLLFRLPPVW